MNPWVFLVHVLIPGDDTHDNYNWKWQLEPIDHISCGYVLYIRISDTTLLGPMILMEIIYGPLSCN